MALIESEVVVVNNADLEESTGGELPAISGIAQSSTVANIGGAVGSVTGAKSNQSSTQANEFVWS